MFVYKHARFEFNIVCLLFSFFAILDNMIKFLYDCFFGLIFFNSKPSQTVCKEESNAPVIRYPLNDFIN